MPSQFDRGEIILALVPYTDLSASSTRPALIVSDGSIGKDIIIAAISSVVRTAANPFDVLVDSSHPEFSITGLKVSSVVRLHRLTTIDHSIVMRRLGRLGPVLQADCDTILAKVLGL